MRDRSRRVPGSQFPEDAEPGIKPGEQGSGGRVIEIVEVTEEYIERLHAAIDAVARERRFLARTEMPPLDSFKERINHHIQMGSPQSVAVCQGRVIGWCDISLNEKPAFAHCGNLGIGVLPSHRGQGIGTGLMRTILERAKEVRLERVELDVFESNQAAIGLYRKFGFEVEGRKVRAVKIDCRYENLLSMALFLKGRL